MKYFLQQVKFLTVISISLVASGSSSLKTIETEMEKKTRGSIWSMS